jgi:asparagine synthetase B (glutamine-hydrolysing)
VIGTHVDCVARAAARHGAVDPVSAADLLLNLTCAYPHTLFEGVEQFPPASTRRFGSLGWSAPARAYWTPSEANPYRTPAEAADALRSGFREAVGAACAGLDEVGLLISGGEDARAVLGALPAGLKVRAFVYADWENREVRVAKAAARAYGAEPVFGRRGPDHYVDGLEAVASMVGSGQCFMDAHGWRLHARLGIDRLPVVLGGLSSDSFLKAEHAPRRAGGPVALPAASAIRPELREAVRERREAFRRWLAGRRPATAGEWERLWPFSMRRHAANLHGNRRMFAAHEPYHARAVLEVAVRVPVEWKRHRALFHAAMQPFFRRAWHVPHARWRYPYFGRWANLPLTAVLRVSRGFRAVATGEVRARQGPWPKWWRVAHSAAAAEKQRRYAPWTGPLAGVFVDAAPAELARSVRAEWPPLREMMLLQLAYLARKATEDDLP